MTNHTLPTPQDATKMRLNLNMLYDPATALARGEALFISDQKPHTETGTQGAQTPPYPDAEARKVRYETIEVQFYELFNHIQCLEWMMGDLVVAIENRQLKDALAGMVFAIHDKGERLCKSFEA